MSRFEMPGSGAWSETAAKGLWDPASQGFNVTISPAWATDPPPPGTPRPPGRDSPGIPPAGPRAARGATRTAGRWRFPAPSGTAVFPPASGEDGAPGDPSRAGVAPAGPTFPSAP